MACEFLVIFLGISEWRFVNFMWDYFFKALSTFISIHEMPASQTSVHCAIVNA